MFVGFGLLIEHATEGSDFQRFVTHHDMDDLEAAADDAGAPEGAPYLFRGRICRNIEIFGVGSDQQITNCAADDIGFVPVLLECLADATATSTNAVAGDAMGGDGDDCGFVVVALGLFAAKNTGNKFTNHVLPFSERL